MPITDGEWQSIAKLIQREIKRSTGVGYFALGRVERIDKATRTFYLDEKGDGVPIFGLNYEAHYYDETPSKTKIPPTGEWSPYRTEKRIAKVEMVMPEVGDYAMLVYPTGNKQVVRCIGFLRSVAGFPIEPED